MFAISTGNSLGKKLENLMLFLSTLHGESKEHNKMTHNSCSLTANSHFNTIPWLTAKLEGFLSIYFHTKASFFYGFSTASLTLLFKLWKNGGMNLLKRSFGSNSKIKKSISLMVTILCIVMKFVWLDIKEENHHQIRKNRTLERKRLV